MNQGTLQLKTITPLLLRGANIQGLGEPELRVPAFRGVLRYWLRALLGATLKDLTNDYSTLFALESKIMGSTDNGSLISLRMPSNEYKTSKEAILPHKEDSAIRKAITTGTALDIILQSRIATAPVLWNTALAAFEVALLFGGVGLRARRGFGTFAIRSSTITQINLTPTLRMDWNAHITDVLTRALTATQAFVKSEGISIATSLPTVAVSFPTASTLGRIRLGDTNYQSASHALKALMQKMPNASFIGSITPRRQSSPLWARVVEVDGEFALLFCVLASNFAGKDYAALDKVLTQFSRVDHTVRGWNL